MFPTSFLLFKILIMCLCVSECELVYLHAVPECVRFLELELRVVVSYQMQVLRTSLRVKVAS